MDTVLEKFQEQWLAAGIVPGRPLLLHSNISRTLRRMRQNGLPPEPKIILDSVLGAIGPDGTLLVPLFNFDFTRGIEFDIRSTPSQMGALTEAARLHPDAVRTGHPVYSFAVLGKLRHRFASVSNRSAYGVDSPFALLRELGGDIAVLDLSDQHSMTFYHHVEEMMAVDYRYMKEFSGNYTNIRGETSERTYSIFVRNLDRGVATHVDPMGERLWECGAYRGCRPGFDSGLRVAAAQRVFAETADVIRSGQAQGTLYVVA